MTSSNDKTIRIWNFFNYADDELKRKVKRIVYSKEGEKIIFASFDFQHFKKKSEEGKEIESEGQIKCVAVSPDGKHIAAGGYDGSIRIFDVEEGIELKELEAHE